MIKLYPSSAAFCAGELVFTKYNSGCHRAMMLKQAGVKEEIDDKHKERGLLNENVYEKDLGAVPFIRERAFTLTIAPAFGAYLSGRIDYIVWPDDPSLKTIIELKSSESPNVLREVIKKRNFKLENVAQLIVYMMAEKCARGKLIYIHYKKDKQDAYYKNAEATFDVAILDDGKILVDNEAIMFSVSDVVNHFVKAAEVVFKGDVGSRPYNADEFAGPCKFCVFNTTCDLYDQGILSSKDDFVNEAKQAIKRKQNV